MSLRFTTRFARIPVLPIAATCLALLSPCFPAGLLNITIQVSTIIRRWRGRGRMILVGRVIQTTVWFEPRTVLALLAEC